MLYWMPLGSNIHKILEYIHIRFEKPTFTIIFAWDNYKDTESGFLNINTEFITTTTNAKLAKYFLIFIYTFGMCLKKILEKGN